MTLRSALLLLALLAPLAAGAQDRPLAALVPAPPMAAPDAMEGPNSPAADPARRATDPEPGTAASRTTDPVPGPPLPTNDGPVAGAPDHAPDHAPDPAPDPAPADATGAPPSSPGDAPAAPPASPADATARATPPGSAGDPTTPTPAPAEAAAPTLTDEAREAALDAACAADPARIAAAAQAPDLADAMFAAFVACLPGLEDATPAQPEALRLLLARGARPDASVEGDAAAGIAAVLDRDDILGLLAPGTPQASLPPDRAAHWMRRRLARLNADATDDDGDPKVTPFRLGPQAEGWEVRGLCGNANCELLLVVMENRRPRIILEDSGHTLRPARTTNRGLYDLTIQARSGAATHTLTTWRYDGTAYRRHRCATTTVTQDPRGRERSRTINNRCADAP
ncbi:hypothetical protein ACE7GA_17500 [Roseomonas sp. CCTCC AB2023176]|uniref:hypothetical protein n=1 Tax=Roseomonas sp. CCTCC AB2023176 TaxID=3342640 RepID=UPI0035DD5D80